MLVIHNREADTYSIRTDVWEHGLTLATLRARGIDDDTIFRARRASRRMCRSRNIVPECRSYVPRATPGVAL